MVVKLLCYRLCFRAPVELQIFLFYLLMWVCVCVDRVGLSFDLPVKKTGVFPTDLMLVKHFCLVSEHNDTHILCVCECV